MQAQQGLSDANVNAIIIGIFGFLTLIVTSVLTYMMSKVKTIAEASKAIAESSAQQSVDNADALKDQGATLKDVAVKVDGMSSHLVAATKEAEYAKGQLKERDAERLHQSERPATPIVTGGTDDPLKVKLVKDDKRTDDQKTRNSAKRGQIE